MLWFLEIKNKSKQSLIQQLSFLADCFCTRRSLFGGLWSYQILYIIAYWAAQELIYNTGKTLHKKKKARISSKAKVLLLSRILLCTCLLFYTAAHLLFCITQVHLFQGQMEAFLHICQRLE